jgi:hypothetical protein
MSIKLHRQGFDNAVRLIRAGEVATFDANWQEEKPTLDETVRFINTHYMNEYGLWFLGVDSKYPSDAKEHYVYPHGDLKMVQRCAIIDSLKHAEKNGNEEITKAAQELLSMIDKRKKNKTSTW